MSPTFNMYAQMLVVQLRVGDRIRTRELLFDHVEHHDCHYQSGQCVLHRECRRYLKHFNSADVFATYFAFTCFAFNTLLEI